MLNVAKPNAEPDALTATLPSVAAPSLKVMVPVGIAVDCGAETLAVKTTVWPKYDGLGAELSVVVVAPFTCSLTVFEVLPAKSVLAL